MLWVTCHTPFESGCFRFAATLGATFIAGFCASRRAAALLLAAASTLVMSAGREEQ
jgi:hypothetical protein